MYHPHIPHCLLLIFYLGDAMSLIWRCAIKAAKESMINRVPIDDVLRATGWAIPEGIERPEDPTSKELAAWVREVAVERRT
jgi:hypothetical protein